MLVLVEEAAREVPLALEGLDAPAREQHPPFVVETRGARGRLRACVRTEAARRTFRAAVLHLDLGRAARTVLPLIELAHVRNNRRGAALRHCNRDRARPGRALPGALR